MYRHIDHNSASFLLKPLLPYIKYPWIGRSRMICIFDTDIVILSQILLHCPNVSAILTLSRRKLIPVAFWSHATKVPPGCLQGPFQNTRNRLRLDLLVMCFDTLQS